jgi:hypothetical protein
MSTDSTQQIETIVQERLARAEQEKQQAIAEAIRVNQEAANSHLSEVVANKDKELAGLRSSVGQLDGDVDTRITEAVQAREAELKELHEQEVKSAAEAAFRRFKQPSNEKILAAGLKHGEKLFNERWEKFQEEQATGGNPVPQEIIAKAVEEASKKKDEEYTEKLQKATEGAKNEAEMRNKLQLGKLQKQVMDTKAKIDLYEKQYGPLPSTPQASPQQQRTQQTQRLPSPIVQAPAQAQATGPVSAPGGQSVPGANVLQKLQAGRGAGIQAGRGQSIPRPGRGGNVQQSVGRGGGQGVGRGQRLSGQQPPQQQQNQGQRPAVNRPLPSGSPTTAGPGGQQQRRQSAQQQQQQQSQLPRPAAGGLNVGATPFQPGGGVKRPRDDENQSGQGSQALGQKRTRVANNGESTGNDGQA